MPGRENSPCKGTGSEKTIQANNLQRLSNRRVWRDKTARDKD